MQIPILNGIYANQQSDFRTSYPINLIPIVKNTGISGGYLRPADGIALFGIGPGVDRGGINWNDTCYRVMGTKLVSVDSLGGVTIIGDVGGTDECSFDYSFDYLAIASNNNLFLYSPSAGLSQVTDPDLGIVVDVTWCSGYFITTDGEFIVVTELNNPFAVDPLKYGSSEVNPDPIVALQVLYNELIVLNRITIETFQVVGGPGFPFERVSGAQSQRGCVGTKACCVFMDRIYFVGNGFNEAVGVYVLNNGQTVKISTDEIDLILEKYSEYELSQIICEGRVGRGYAHLWVRLPDRTVVFDFLSTQKVNEPIWFSLSSDINGYSAYRAKNLVYCYGKWIVGDINTNNLGILTSDISSQYGDTVGWEFGTQIIYNKGNGAAFQQLELVGLPGRCQFGADPSIATQYSFDGETWSDPKFISAGKQGNYTKRVVWFQNGIMHNYRLQKFFGTSDTFMSFSALEAQIEPFNA